MNPDRKDRSEYILVKDQLKSLVGAGSTSPGEEDTKEEIERRMENADLRLQYFIEDIILLNRRDGLENEEEVFDSLAAVNGRIDSTEWDVWHVLGGEDTNERELGSALAQLVRPFFEDSDLSKEGIIWGFITGLASKSRQEARQEQNDISEILDKIDIRLEMREKFGELRNGVDDEVPLYIEEERAVRKLGVEPSQTLVDAADNLRSYMLIESGMISEGIKVGDSVDEEQLTKFKEIWELILTELISDNPRFAKAKQLRQDLDEDTTKATESGWNGIRPIDVVSVIAQRGGEEETATVADEIAKKRDDITPSPQGVGKVARDLAGRDEDTPGYNWADRPILTIQSSDPQKLALTEYGRLIALRNSNQKKCYNQLHAYALSPDSCENRQLLSTVIERHYDMKHHKTVNTIRHNVRKNAFKNGG